MWPELNLPPLNLWNFPEWRWYENYRIRNNLQREAQQTPQEDKKGEEGWEYKQGMLHLTYQRSKKDS